VETVIKDGTVVKKTLETEMNKLNKVKDEVRKIDDGVVTLSEGSMAGNH
jgi:chaperonin cofactor prefoldin